MLKRLKGNIFLLCSDPAGAKVCLALGQALLQHDPLNVVTVFSNRKYDFESDWAIPIQHTDGIETLSLVGKPDCVFTGTSHPDSSGGFELRGLRWAKAQGVHSYSYVDHWTNIKLRFTLNGALVYPDRILMPDAHAVELADRDGLPAGLLEVFPNPYLEYITKGWHPRLSKESILKPLGLLPNQTVILYAPDPISLRERDDCPFDEISVLKELAQAMDRLARPEIVLLVKTHPLQPMNAINRVVTTNKNVFIAPGTNLLELLQISDLVIGFHSNLLLEAKALGKNIARYLPGENVDDPLAHLNVGTKIKTSHELFEMLTQAGAS